MTVPVPAVPQPDADQRLRGAISRRDETDYVFDFWTALGWTIVTFGLFAFYIAFQLFQRSVRHNRRRIEVLEAATAVLWERTVQQGRADELTPRFQAVGVDVAELRRVAGEFRDPTIWTIIVAVSGGIGQVIGSVLLDMDLVRHEAAERAAEEELAAIGAAVGSPLHLPSAPAPKARHDYVKRVIALLLTCGLYGIWWVRDVMVEGNANFRADWSREDAIWVGLTS